jgi:hypothetical protein
LSKFFGTGYNRSPKKTHLLEVVPVAFKLKAVADEALLC